MAAGNLLLLLVGDASPARSAARSQPECTFQSACTSSHR
jgi:hypothetical protein